MGGMVAQEFAINYPDRILSLTSLISTPAVLDPTTMQYSSGLPTIEQRAMDVLIEMSMAQPTSRQEELENFLKLARMLTGSGYEPLDEEAALRVRNLELDRAADMSKSDNHSRAITASQDRVQRLGAVAVPTLVIHGTEDPMFPLPHGEATAKAVPGAKLVVVGGMGHTPPRTKDFAVMLLEHTA
jgi:pimeloyl-ACP methyl ester carboxylesterase